MVGRTSNRREPQAHSPRRAGSKLGGHDFPRLSLLEAKGLTPGCPHCLSLCRAPASKVWEASVSARPFSTSSKICCAALHAAYAGGLIALCLSLSLCECRGRKDTAPLLDKHLQNLRAQSSVHDGSRAPHLSWEREAVLEKVQHRLDHNPDAMGIRRQTAEYPFGTMKCWMGATHFLTKRGPRWPPRWRSTCSPATCSA